MSSTSAEQPDAARTEEPNVETVVDQTSDTRPVSTATRRTPRRPSTRQILEVADSYSGDIPGAAALASAVAAAVRRWGIWWTGEKAERIAYAQAAWLLTNFPEGGFLALHAGYDPSTTWLSIVVRDAGSRLPALDGGDEWRMSLGPNVRAYARHYDGNARELEVLFKI